MLQSTNGRTIRNELFCHDGLQNLHKISGRIYIIQYQGVLYDHWIPLLPNWVFLQYSGCCHTSKSNQKCIKNIVLPWSSRRLNLKPIKNLWSLLCCKANNKQLLSPNELEIVIVRQGNNISVYELNYLV